MAGILKVNVDDFVQLLEVKLRSFVWRLFGKKAKDRISNLLMNFETTHTRRVKK